MKTGGRSTGNRALHAAVGLRLAISLFCFLLPFVTARASSGRLPTLHTQHEVFILSKAEAAKGYPIELDGVVLYSDPEWGVLFVQDKTGPTFIDVHGIRTVFALGTHVRVEAVTGTNEDGAIVAHPKIVVLGPGPLPKTLRKTVAELEKATDESDLVVTEGILHPCERDYLRVCFRIYDGKDFAWLVVPQAASPAAQSLVGSVVRVRGVIGRHVDPEGHRLGAQLYVNNMKDIEVVASAAFAGPPTLIGDLRPSEADVRFVKPVHLHGTVTWATPGHISVQDGSGTAFVGTAQDASIHLGDIVEAIGFPSHGTYGLELADSFVQLAPVQSNPVGLAPLSLTAEEILKHSVSGKRVRLRARLAGQRKEATAFVYEFEEGGQRFNAILPRNEATRETVSLPPDSAIELTGVAVIRGGTPEWPESLAVLISSPADMVVLGGNSWLTPRRGLAILGIVAGCAIVPLVWATALKRTVQRQTGIIQARLQRELQLENKFRRLFERNLAAVFSWRADGAILECNEASARLLGFRTREQLIGRSYWDFQARYASREQLRNELPNEGVSDREASLRRDDGVTVHLLMNITPVDTPEGRVYETTAIDVTRLRQKEEELQRAKDLAVYESLNDPLTGLPNRRLLLDRLSFLLAKAKRDGGTMALLYIDLDGFKLVNDSLGHPIGDALLIQVANCLRARVRESDVLARLGGDEFMMILDGLHGRNEAAHVAECMLEALSKPMRVEGHELALSASIGISVFPDHAGDAEDLIRKADCAMYAAKREGKNRVVFFNSEIGGLVQERMTLENQLRGALSRCEIAVHYQPEYDMAGSHLVRFEALARWTHPTLGLIPPTKFIPIAEESGMIGALGAYVMERACTEAVRWQGLEPNPIQVAVNVSSIQFRRKGFVEEVSAILARTGLPAELLQIELTESVMLNGARGAAETMKQLRELGVSLAIDDFGTGYSNMSYLPSLPFDALKIDRSFILNLDTQPENESMIRTLVALARNIGMTVIVEGVETQAHLDLVKSMGANEAQGYLLGRPHANPVETYLRSESK